jgi:oligopeptide transport system substrate-binding protein
MFTAVAKVGCLAGRITAAALVIALVMTACGRGRPASEPAKSPARSASISELKVAIADPRSIEPFKASTRAGLFVVKQICDSLIGLAPATAALRPAIAESWALAPDAKKLTLNLRPGVRFHNGRELVAEDYVYSLSRLVHPQAGSPQHYLLDKIAGYPEVRSGKSTTLAGVKASQPLRLEIDLVEPYAEFPAVLSHPTMGAAVPKEEVDRSPESFAAKPACTGPYMVQSPRETGRDIRLTKFDDYYGKNEAFSRGGAGYAESITVRIAPDEPAAYEYLESGQVNVAPVPTSALAEARRVRGRVHSGPNGHVAYLGLPTKKAPYGNPTFRKALALSVDRNEIINGLLARSRQSPTGFLPSTAGPVARESTCRKTVPPRASESQAKQALSDSGIDSGMLKMNIYLNSGGGHERWLQEVINGWRTVLGIDATLKPSAWEPYVAFLAKPGADGPFRLAWSVRFPSPEALYAPLFSSGSLDNFTGYSSPQFDALIARARRTVDDSERAKIYAEVGQVLCREIPLIPMWFGLSHFAFSPGVTAPGNRYMDVFGDPVVRELTFKR